MLNKMLTKVAIIVLMIVATCSNVISSTETIQAELFRTCPFGTCQRGFMDTSSEWSEKTEIEFIYCNFTIETGAEGTENCYTPDFSDESNRECVQASVNNQAQGLKLEYGYRMVAFWPFGIYRGNEKETDVIFDTFRDLEFLLEETEEVDREVWKTKYCMNDCRSAIQQWAGLWPVSDIFTETSDVVTEVVYVNKLCALCHDAVNITVWKAEIKCEPSIRNEDPMDLIVNFIQNKIANDRCKVQFEPPINRSNQAIENTFLEDNYRCVLHRLTSCYKNESFIIPPNTNLSKQDIIKGCETKNVYSQKLYINEIFSNKFCEICNGIYNLNETSRILMRDNGNIITTPFTLHINYLDLSVVMGLHDTETTVNTPEACNPDNSEDCRPILCPTGRIRSAEGQCLLIKSRTRLSSHFHDTYKYTLSVEMTKNDDQSVILSDFIVSCQGDCRRLLRFPNETECGFHDWEVIYFGVEYENVIPQDAHLHKFIIFLGYFGESTDIEHILEESRKLAEGQWGLVLGDSLIFIQAGFYKPIEVSVDEVEDTSIFPRRKRFVKREIGSMDIVSGVTPITLFETVPTWALYAYAIPRELDVQKQLVIYQHPLLTLDNYRDNDESFILERMYYRSNGNHFTKMHYCDQIYLFDTEFDLLFSDNILYYKPLEKYLYLGEFELHRDPMSGKGTSMARVCMSSTKFVVSPSSDSMLPSKMALPSTGNASVQKVMCSVILVFIATIIMIL